MKYEVTPVLCNEKNMANYAYIVHTPNRETTIVVDAAEANPTIAALERLKLHPSFILTTHHHFDHVEGNLKLKEKYGARKRICQSPRCGHSCCRKHPSASE